MPIIRIEFDDNKVDFDAIKQLSQAAQQIVSQNTQIKDAMEIRCRNLNSVSKKLSNKNSNKYIAILH